MATAVLAIPQAAGSDDGAGVLLVACLEIADAGRRLTCFEDVAGRVIGNHQGDRAASAEHDPEAAFGKPLGKLERKPLPAIRSTIDRVEQRPRGRRLFYLTNGQVWTEVEAGRSRYQPGMQVEIERTPMGSHLLSTVRGQVTRVRRVD